MNQIVTIHTDGASRGNPGEAAIAYVIEGAPAEPMIYGQAIGRASNNQAEYRALIAAAQKILDLDVRDLTLEFRADSELMIKQLKGEYRVKDLGLRARWAEARELIGALEDRGNICQFKAIAREQNRRADRLANAELDAK